MCVRDLDKALEFYRDILGMTVTVDRMQDTSTGGLPHVYAHNRSTRRQAVLTYGDGAAPTLVMTSHPGDDADGAPIKLDQVGISHISFTVPDVKALADELISKGVELARAHGRIRQRKRRGFKHFRYDPDGILVQFDSGGG